MFNSRKDRQGVLRCVKGVFSGDFNVIGGSVFDDELSFTNEMEFCQYLSII